MVRWSASAFLGHEGVLMGHSSSANTEILKSPVTNFGECLENKKKAPFYGRAP